MEQLACKFRTEKFAGRLKKSARLPRYFGIVGNGKLHVLDIAAPGTCADEKLSEESKTGT